MNTSFRLFTGIVAFLILQALPLEGSALERGAATSGIDYRDGRIKISVDDRPLEDVVEEVAQKSGIRVIDNHPSREAVSMHLDYLPVAASLQRLLQGRDYVFFYRAGKPGDEPVLTQVVVLPKEGGRVTAGTGPVENVPAPGTAGAEPEPGDGHFRNAGLEQLLEDVETEQIDIESTITSALQRIHEMAPLPATEMVPDDSGSEGGPAYLSRGVTTGSVPDNVGQGRRSSAQRSGKGASSQAGQSASQEQTQDTTNTGKDDPEPTDPDGQPQPGDPDYDPLAPLRPILEQALEAQKNRPPQSDPPLPNR